MTVPKRPSSRARATPFDEFAYRDALVAAGMPPDDAASLARRTAEARKASDEVAAPASNVLGLPSPADEAAFDSVDDPAGTPAKKSGRASKEKPIRAVFDYRNGKIPERVRELIEAHLAIEREDAKSAGTLGFMTRALAIATLPHRRQDDFRFVRRNGDFVLTMMTAHPSGLPFGTVPRMLLTWACTEVVRTGERVLCLGNSLAAYLAELGLHNSGGERGDITRLKHAMTTLFSAVISCHYEGKDTWALSNVLLADRIEWWTPQNPEEAGRWQSYLQLSEPFFKECLEHPLPIDVRAMRVLRRAPLALDIYVWLTHRMSYLSRRTTIPWISLAGQFGAGYAMDEQGLRDFKRAFLRELKHVVAVYPEAKVSDSPNGLVLYPSPTHVAASVTPRQRKLAL